MPPARPPLPAPVPPPRNGSPAGRRTPPGRSAATLLGAAAAFLLLLAPPLLSARSPLPFEGGILALGAEGVALQPDPVSCGPAALVALLAALEPELGRPPPRLGAAVAAARPGPRGIDLAGFEALAREFGLSGGWFRLERLDAARAPLVVHLDAPFGAPANADSGHFAVVTAHDPRYVALVDPLRGRLLLRRSRFERHWSGRAFLPDLPAAPRRAAPADSDRRGPRS